MARTPRNSANEDNVVQDDANVNQTGDSPSGAPLDPSGKEAIFRNDSDQSDNGSDGSDDESQLVPEPDNGSPMPTDEELDKIDELEKVRDDTHEADIVNSVRKILNVAASYPATTSDEHTCFGFGGHVVKLGDIRRVAIALKRTARGE